MTTRYISDVDLGYHARHNTPQLETKQVSDVFYLYPHTLLADAGHFNKDFFSVKSMNYISQEVTRLLQGVHPDGKNIIVPFEQIRSVMDSIYTNNPHEYWKTLLRMVVVYIVEWIKQEYESDEYNRSLDVEVIKYTGDYGIRKVPHIKLRERRATPFIFNMKY